MFQGKACNAVFECHISVFLIDTGINRAVGLQNRDFKGEFLRKVCRFGTFNRLANHKPFQWVVLNLESIMVEINKVTIIHIIHVIYQRKLVGIGGKYLITIRCSNFLKIILHPHNNPHLCSVNSQYTICIGGKYHFIDTA